MGVNWDLRGTSRVGGLRRRVELGIGIGLAIELTRSFMAVWMVSLAEVPRRKRVCFGFSMIFGSLFSRARFERALRGFLQIQLLDRKTNEEEAIKIVYYAITYTIRSMIVTVVGLVVGTRR